MYHRTIGFTCNRSTNIVRSSWSWRSSSLCNKKKVTRRVPSSWEFRLEKKILIYWQDQAPSLQGHQRWHHFHHQKLFSRLLPQPFSVSRNKLRRHWKRKPHTNFEDSSTMLVSFRVSFQATRFFASKIVASRVLENKRIASQMQRSARSPWMRTISLFWQKSRV